MQEKLQQATFDFSDFVQQMRLIKRMGSLGGLMKLIPGMNKIDDGMLKQGEQQLKKIEAMISSMTEAERRDPDLLAASPSRRRRIAAGSGHGPADVDKVLQNFQQMRGFMQQMTRGGGMPGLPGMAGMPGMGGLPGNGWPAGDGWWARGCRQTGQARQTRQKAQGLRGALAPPGATINLWTLSG
jgi:signal recognition particle subunit SRP54